MKVLILREEIANQPIEASGDKNWMGLGSTGEAPGAFMRRTPKEREGKNTPVSRG